MPGRSGSPPVASGPRRCRSAFTTVPRRAPGRRMHDHAGRLVDGEEMRVLVEDDQRQGLGFDAGGLRRWHGDGDPLTRAHRVRGLARHAVDGDVTAVDQALRPRPRPELGEGRQEAIESHAGRIRRHAHHEAARARH